MFFHFQLPSVRAVHELTSLTAKGHMLYTGLENGLILCIHCTDMCVSQLFSTYDRAVYSLMIMKPPKEALGHKASPLVGKQKHFYHSDRPQRTPPPKRLPLKNLSPASRRRNFTCRSKPNNYSLELSPLSQAVNPGKETPEDMLLISIGTGYKGVMGSHDNYPKDFVLPSIADLQRNTGPAKAEASSGHLLVWSTEKCGEEDDGGEETIAG